MYPKDWLEGTAELSPEAKGVYIDLLCYQHQRGDLPSDSKIISRLVRLSEDEFLTVWCEIKDKFTENKGRLLNVRMKKEMNERKIKGHKNKIIGTFASLLRKNPVPVKEYKLIKEAFIVDDFMQYDSDQITERLTEWFSERLKSIANANADINTDKEILNNIKYIVDYLNSKAGKKYKYNSETTKDKIIARFNEGYSVDDFKKVIEIKCKEWVGDNKMEAYLRPETLFSPKFEGYLNQKSTAVKSTPFQR